MKARWVTLKNIVDERGTLIAAESQRDIPFEIKRVYCLTQSNNKPRGFHAHKALQQVIVCLSGQCVVRLSDGVYEIVETLQPHQPSLFVDKMIWRELHDFSTDCVLMILASEWYDEADYIRNFDEFKKLIAEKNE